MDLLDLLNLLDLLDLLMGLDLIDDLLLDVLKMAGDLKNVV